MYEIVLINGKDYPVRFGMNALRMFCKDTDRALSDLDKLGESMSLDDACFLILLRHYDLFELKKIREKLNSKIH